MGPAVIFGAALGACLAGSVAKWQLPHAGLGIGFLWPLAAMTGAVLGGLVGWACE